MNPWPKTDVDLRADAFRLATGALDAGAHIETTVLEDADLIYRWLKTGELPKVLD